MSGTGGNAPQPGPQIPGLNTQQFARLVQSLRRQGPDFRIRQRLRDTGSAIADGARAVGRPVRDVAVVGYDATVEFIVDTARTTANGISGLAATSKDILLEQRAFTGAAGDSVFDYTGIALELSGIGGAAASQYIPPGGKPYFAVLPGAAGLKELQSWLTGEGSGLGDLDGKPNPVLVEYYIAHRRDIAALRVGNRAVQRYLELRHRSASFGALAGFSAVVSGLIVSGKVGPFLNAGLHVPALGSTVWHGAALTAMSSSPNLDPVLKRWLALLIEIKAVKALIRANLTSLSLPVTSETVWFQLMSASAARLIHRPIIVGACCVAAADLHARAHVEQGFAARAPLLPANAPGQTASQPGTAGPTRAPFVARASGIQPPAGPAASQPATEIITELFSKFGKQSTTDPLAIIEAPAGWIAIANKMMLM